MGGILLDVAGKEVQCFINTVSEIPAAWHTHMKATVVTSGKHRRGIGFGVGAVNTTGGVPVYTYMYVMQLTKG